MPGQTTLETSHSAGDLLSFAAQSNLRDGRSVHFTDENISFTLEVTNKSEERVTGDVNWVLDYASTDHQQTGSFWVDLVSGEDHTEVINIDIVPYQSNIVFGIENPIAWKLNDKTDISLAYGKNPEFKPIYVVSVWDRTFYRVNYQNPRYAQYASVILSILIVLFAAAQVFGWFS